MQQVVQIISAQPVEPPPDLVVITLTREQAGRLMTILGQNEAISSFDPERRQVIEANGNHRLARLYHHLEDMGIKKA